MLAGAAGIATSGGTEPGGGKLVRGEGSFEHSGEREGAKAGEKVVGEDAQVGLRRQVVRRTLRAGKGERGETWRSGDSVEGPPVIATNSSTFSHPTHPAHPIRSPYHISHPPRLSHSSRLSRLSHLSYPSDGAVAWSEVTQDAPGVAPLPLPSDGVGRQLQQANNLPLECRDGSAMAAVALETRIHDFIFPSTSSHLTLRPFEITLTNKCGQRAIAQLSITIGGEMQFYLLMPRLLHVHWDAQKHVYTFNVLPPLGAPDGAVIIPQGGSFIFNCTIVRDTGYIVSVKAAAFVPLNPQSL